MTSPTSGNAAYAYDAMGRRVRKTWTPGGGTAENTYYVYDIAGNLAAEYGTGTAPASGTVYPFVDLLGSVRMVTDAAGAVVECYDYLPFGRMLSSSDNGRSTLNCHPPEPDTAIGGSTSQKFTGQVRDGESRLDYLGARYMSAPQGRFLSPDPLLNSGRPWLPQSWNKYSYALNNPLTLIDPTGLYVCDGTDEECDLIKAALARVTEARNKFTEGTDEYMLLNSVLTAYGTAGVDNGVTVSFSSVMDKDTGALTDVRRSDRVTATNPSGQDSSVRLNSTYADHLDGIALTVAHEGVHVAHGTTALTAIVRGTERFLLNEYERETMAFTAQSFMAQAIDWSPLPLAGFEIWNSKWKEADIKTLRSNGIERILADPSGLYQLTPENPGEILFPHLR